MQSWKKPAKVQIVFNKNHSKNPRTFINAVLKSLLLLSFSSNFFFVFSFAFDEMSEKCCPLNLDCKIFFIAL